MSRERQPTPLEGYGVVAVFLRFCLAALFGGLIDMILIFAVLDAPGQLDAKEGKWLLIVLIIVPIVWGILGVFCLRRMLKLARDLFEQWFM